MKMKKIVPVLLLGLALVSCGNKKDEVKPKEVTVSQDSSSHENENVEVANDVKKFVVKEVNDEGLKLAIDDEGSEDNFFMATFKELGSNDFKVGDKLEIEWDGIIKPSDPAQFGKIIRVEKINE